MKTSVYTIRLQTPADEADIEMLAAKAFGPGRFARSAFRLREGKPSVPELSFVAVLNKADKEDNTVGAVQLTEILIGGQTALLLGPLVVTPSMKNSGIGAALMEKAVFAARQAGYRYIILVGDEPYYSRFDFRKIPRGRITLPGPADPDRILGCELDDGAALDFEGKAERKP